MLGEGGSMPDMLDMMVIITTMPNDNRRFLPETRDNSGQVNKSNEAAAAAACLPGWKKSWKSEN